MLRCWDWRKVDGGSVVFSRREAKGKLYRDINLAIGRLEGGEGKKRLLMATKGYSEGQ